MKKAKLHCNNVRVCRDDDPMLKEVHLFLEPQYILSLTDKTRPGHTGVFFQVVKPGTSENHHYWLVDGKPMTTDNLPDSEEFTLVPYPIDRLINDEDLLRNILTTEFLL